MCLGDWNRGACLGLYLDRFNHSVLTFVLNTVFEMILTFMILISVSLLKAVVSRWEDDGGGGDCG